MRDNDAATKFNQAVPPRATPPDMMDTVHAFCGAVESGESRLEQESRLVHCLNRFMACADRPVSLRPVPEPVPIARAKRYLKEGFSESATLAEGFLPVDVAMLLGFADQAHLPANQENLGNHTRSLRGPSMTP